MVLLVPRPLLRREGLRVFLVVAMEGAVALHQGEELGQVEEGPVRLGVVPEVEVELVMEAEEEVELAVLVGWSGRQYGNGSPRASATATARASSSRSSSSASSSPMTRARRRRRAGGSWSGRQSHRTIRIVRRIRMKVLSSRCSIFVAGQEQLMMLSRDDLWCIKGGMV